MKRARFILDLDVPDGVDLHRVVGNMADAADDLGCEFRARPCWERIPELHLVKPGVNWPK